MSTSTGHASTTTLDSVVVGFGPRKPVVEGSVHKNYGGKGGVKSASTVFTFRDAMVAAANVNVPVPAGSHIISVTLQVESAFLGGTSLTVGDGSSATGFIDATQGAVANLTAGALLTGTGAYSKGGTDTTAQEFKLYASADTIDVTANGTFTAGKATLTVNYV